jgi:hypothetical protein
MAVYRSAIGAALIAVALGWCCYVVWSTSFFQDCIASEKQRETPAQVKETTPEVAVSRVVVARMDAACALKSIYEYRDAVTAIATIFIALFTFTLWSATRNLWAVTKSAVDLARDEFNATHRPRIQIRNLVVAQGSSPTLFSAQAPIRGQFFLTNTGEGKAFISALGCWVHLETSGDFLPMRRPYEGQAPNIAIVPFSLIPGASEAIPFNSGDVTPPNGEIASSLSAGRGSTVLYVMGFVEFMDDSNFLRRHHFCRKWNDRRRFVRVNDDDYEGDA